MSRRAKRPLNQKAVQKADDEIYRRHEGDPRPNALYDATGHRILLSATDPAQANLRNEWMDLYEANGGAVENVAPDTNPPGPSLHCNPPTPVPDPAQVPSLPSFNNHWIEVAVVPEQWGGKRPAYWPPEPTAGIYAAELFDAKITDGNRFGSLSASGGFSYYSMPEGSCSFHLTECLKKSDDDMQKATEYKSPYPLGDS